MAGLPARPPPSKPCNHLAVLNRSRWTTAAASATWRARRSGSARHTACAAASSTSKAGQGGGLEGCRVGRGAEGAGGQRGRGHRGGGRERGERGGGGEGGRGGRGTEGEGGGQRGRGCRGSGGWGNRGHNTAAMGLVLVCPCCLRVGHCLPAWGGTTVAAAQHPLTSQRALPHHHCPRFRVRAENEAGRSLWSPLGEGRTAAVAPAACSASVVLGKSQTSLSIRWEVRSIDMEPACLACC